MIRERQGSCSSPESTFWDLVFWRRCLTPRNREKRRRRVAMVADTVTVTTMYGNWDGPTIIGTTER